MAAINSINIKRVFLGGGVAGAIQFVFNGVVNGAILSGDFQDWAKEMGNLIHPLSMSRSMILWATMCFIYGLSGVWIYAGIRPRYGVGPKTALLSGLMVWVIGKLATALDLISLGILPSRLIVGQLIGSFVAITVGVFAGAWVYRE